MPLPWPLLGPVCLLLEKGLKIAVSGDKMHPHAEVSNKNANTCAVIRAVYWVICIILNT